MASDIRYVSKSADELATSGRIPVDHDPGGAELKKTHRLRVANGFLEAYLSGDVVLDIGNTGSGNPDNRTVVPHAIGIDLDYPGYDGTVLPFANDSVDTVFSSHCMEHVWFAEAVIRDHYRVLKQGGFIVTIVPHQHLYEKRRFLPSRYNPDHKRMFTPASLLELYERTLEPNSYRVEMLRDNDLWFNYDVGPDEHSFGCYEIELVLRKISPPSWTLA